MPIALLSAHGLKETTLAVFQAGSTHGKDSLTMQKIERTFN
jgi:hypothetical protein